MMTSISEYADRIMALIAGDVAAGLVPRGVGSFSRLHDHVDANDYLIEAKVPWSTDPGAGEDGSELVNAVTDEVDRRIGAGGLRR